MKGRKDCVAGAHDSAVDSRKAKPRAKPHGLRHAVNGKCRECIYCKSGPETWRQQVAACTSKTCRHYSVRPMPANGIARELTALEIPENGDFSASVDGPGVCHE